MKNVFKTLAVLLTLFSLTGCGLKGPLYFPPADKKYAAADEKSRFTNAVHAAR
ncbi:lipoprotein [Salmonella enterica subsp. arizonae]|nr:lipoprotein [Salmonella enterica subsp. arizonae]